MTFLKQLGFLEGRVAGLPSLVASVVLGTMLLVLASPATAEEPNSKRRRTAVILRLSEALDLDEEQTLKLAAQYRRFDTRRNELIGQRRVTESELEAALGRSEQDEAQIRKLTDQLLEIDKERVLMPDALFESMQSVLDTNQRARFALFKMKLQRKIDRERTRRQQKRAGGRKKEKN